MSSTIHCEVYGHHYSVGTNPALYLLQAQQTPKLTELAALSELLSLSFGVCCVCVGSDILQALNPSLSLQTFLVLVNCLRDSQFPCKVSVMLPYACSMHPSRRLAGEGYRVIKTRSQQSACTIAQTWPGRRHLQDPKVRWGRTQAACQESPLQLPKAEAAPSP